jgi:hypothetical protein
VVALLWIARAIILLLILRIVLRLLFGGGRIATSRPAPGGGSVERAGGELVRDPQCGTYIPKARAVVVGSGADTKYFCSTKCRDAYGRTQG